MWGQIKSGAWLTPERLRNYSLILLAVSAVAAVIWIALADGLVDRNDKPIGTDFSNVWAAGKLVLDGQPDAPFDPVRQYAAEKEAFPGHPVPFFGWHYPPLFLIVAAALALVPYGWALLIWTSVTLAAYLATMRAIVPRPETVLLALAFPATFVNLGHGQNGFLTASLLGGALLLLDRRPILAGVLIGLLAYKPQFGVMIPLVLLATLRWRVIAAAAATVLVACAMTLVLFGTKVWVAFAEFTGFTRVVVLEAGDTGWEKIQSIFSAVRMWGGSIDAAYAAQAALALAVAASLVWLWRSRAADDLKAAALACRLPDRDALRARLRPRRAGGRDRVLRAPRIGARLPRLRDQPPGFRLGDAADRAQHRGLDRPAARPDRHAGALRSHDAACRRSILRDKRRTRRSPRHELDCRLRAGPRSKSVIQEASPLFPLMPAKAGIQFLTRAGSPLSRGRAEPIAD